MNDRFEIATRLFVAWISNREHSYKWTTDDSKQLRCWALNEAENLIREDLERKPITERGTKL